MTDEGMARAGRTDRAEAAVPFRAMPVCASRAGGELHGAAAFLDGMGECEKDVR